MEEFDTTTPEKTESERQADLIATLDGLLAEVLQRLARLEPVWEALDGLNERLEALNPRNGALAEILQRLEHLEHLVANLEDQSDGDGQRLANLETQRTPADNNMDDPEWY